ARRGPGGGIARRYLARVGEACFARRPGLPLDDGDIMPRFGEIPRRRHPDDASAQNRNFHFYNLVAGADLLAHPWAEGRKDGNLPDSPGEALSLAQRPIHDYRASG